MIDSLYSILEFIQKDVNPYYILPFIFAFIVLFIQWKKGNKYLLSLTFYTFEIFSITTSMEYIFIFLYTETLPKSIALLDKIILFIGTSIAFLFIFLHTTEGSWIGNWINNVLNKYFLPNPTPMSILPFVKQLEELKSSRENIMTRNNEQVNNAYHVFLENGSSIMMALTKNYSVNDENIIQIQTLFDGCKKDFKDMCDFQIFDEENIVKTVGALSEFIGSVDGFTKKSK